MYDVAIIGSGIVGAACAYRLSRFNLKTVVIEKNNDVCCGTTKANSAIIHAGYDPKPNTLMARLNVEGSKMTQEICEKLDIPYKQIGSLVAAFSEEEAKTIEELYQRGVKNGVQDIKVIGKDELKKLEPNISDEAVCALYAPTAAIVNPWEYGLAMAETAVRNGTEIMLEAEVTGIDKKENSWNIHTAKGDIEAAYVINAAGVNSDDIHNMVAEETFRILPSAGEYYLLDKSEGTRVSHIVFQCPNKEGKGTLVAPTVHGNLIVGPNSVSGDKEDISTKTASLDFIRETASKSVPSIAFRENIRNFTGIRANSTINDFIIEFAAEHFLDLAGIKSPGLSAAPAIAKMAEEMLIENGLEAVEKENFIDKRTHIVFKHLSAPVKNQVIYQNPAYGRVICRCETITEGEIIAALNSPIPPVSLDGIKRRAGSGMGRCQGGFCGPKILEIMAKFKNTDYENILQDNTGSYILTEPTKNGRQK
ncbi:MAG: NAD(P)/FAD-dependent oxidoreductase [Eubacterium sp.]|nr:NAD(P)/FAD-dependent oxidoreductase [Eubacterium sp.]